MNVNAVNVLRVGQEMSHRARVTHAKVGRSWYSGAGCESAPSEVGTHTGRTDRAVWTRPTSYPEHGPSRPREARADVSVLSRESQLGVLAGLVEGNSERAIERMTGVCRQAIGRLALRLGEGAQRLHDRLVRDLSCNLVDVDEMWGFCQVKQSRVRPDHGPDAGEQWTWVAIDRLSKLVIAFHVGRRDAESAGVFIKDLRSRLVMMPQLMTSDGLKEYVAPIVQEFGYSASYIQTIKSSRSGRKLDPDHRYEPPRDIYVVKRTVLGAEDTKLATTYALERQHLTMRHHIGRMRRLVLAFSKRLPNHRAACALNYVHYNMCLVQRGLRVTPAMAAKVTDHLWELPELLDALLVEPVGEKPAKQPLAHRAPEGPARELPAGRGFLRLVQGGKGAAPAPVPTTPAPVAAAPAAAPASPSPAPTDDRQLDLFAWRPKPPPPAQLNLFGDPDVL